ncbi:hypothetical protein GH714_019605 [Hevea brasiliensis]|uniref:DC1 domain-containing protein n=1 Tax=Hevea brasiliensis TaxID=3981 RepID=A0A6A6N5N6_HEVBR|nr:hypothetical protein GH714_019605 [Hevea brasiliensis]
MEVANSGEQKQPKLPVIIAIRGSLNNQQSEIAYKLAMSLNHPLIDERDISQMIPDLQNPLLTPSTTATSTSFSKDLSFKLAIQISSTLLLLKFPVIINTSLSEIYHFELLLQLAASKEALLIIIDCSSDQINPVLDNDYRAKHVRFFSISMMERLMWRDLSLRYLGLWKTMKRYIFRTLKVEVKVKGANLKYLILHRIVMMPDLSLLTEAHAHEFSFTEEPKIGSNELHCNHCQNVISGPIYQCVECDEFILHKACAELSTDLEVISKSRLFYINPKPSYYNFPVTYKCKVCESYSSKCNNCLLQTHIRCGVLPTICRHERHEHPLSFVIMPFWFDYEYKCYECDEFGKFIGYKCFGCCLDFHTSCAISKREIRDVDPPTMTSKIIGGQPTESALQETYAFRREMIKKAIGAGYLRNK